MKTIKKMIEWDIMLAINELSSKIQKSLSCDQEENHLNSESIKLLAEAYDIVHRGKKSHEF